MPLAGGVGAQDLQILQRQLDEKTTECKSLKGSRDEAMRQAICASNDADLWQGAYQQAVEADLEGQNGELLQENRQLKEKLEQAVAAAERAGESPMVILEYHSVTSTAEEFFWFASIFASATIM